MKEDKYTKSLAKNQVYAIVHMRDIRKNVLPKFIKLCMETPCLCPFQGHKYGRRKPTETSVFEFSYLCVNSSLEELIKIKAIFILRQGMFRWQNLQKSVMFLTLIGTFLAAAFAPKAWLNQGLAGCKTGWTNQTFPVFKAVLSDFTIIYM